MSKYKLNHNFVEQTCLSYYLVHTHRFLSHSIESVLYCMTLCILYYVRKTQRLEARRRAKLGESKIATKLADKTLSNASILLKRDGHTYSIYMFIPRFQLVKCPLSSFYEEIY